ncbi:MAG TPA: TIGR04283 family arsenosugar biosynthesis glycosyltransferase [Mariprofundaceae bacterium]|nr:TIGR04283 family arsenosugar biosynthesis glycosyltransferase [Mariprofundaceae bacterium]
MRPSIGVVVPVYNESAILTACMDRARRLGAETVIFVDGGSDDGSPDLLRASGMRWMRTQRGRAGQMNAGASAIDNDIILFLHADTDMDSSHIEAIRQAMADPQYVGGRFDVRLQGEHPCLGLIALLINLRSRISRIATGDQAIFVRRSVFMDMGGFADMPLMEDVEFCRRLKRRGRIACLHHKVSTSGRRWERHGIVHTMVLMWWLRLRFWLGADPASLARMYRDAR